jgi:hypothetical protein
MSHTLWVGVLIGVPVGTFAPQWIKIVVFVIALLLSEVERGASHGVGNLGHVHFVWPPWLVGVIGVVIGLLALHYARRRGLAHLGQSELRSRWTNVRGISKWGW